MNEYSHWLIYYDEVLTQSARNYAFTLDIKWKKRYNRNLDELYKLIEVVLSKSQSDDLKLFKEFDYVNNQLAILENQSFKAIDQGNQFYAIKILDSPKYESFKSRYQNLIQKFLKVKTLSYRSSFSKFKDETFKTIKLNRSKTNVVSNTSLFILIFFILFLALIIFLVIKRINKIKSFVDQAIVGDNFNTITNKDGNELDEYVSSLIETIRSSYSLKNKELSDAITVELESLRNEFKRNLHDRLGVLVSATKLHFYFLKPLDINDLKNKHYDTCLKLIDQTYNEIKQLSSTDQVVNDLQLIDRIQAIISFFKSLQQIEIHFNSSLNDAFLSKMEKQTLELLIREELNNVVNHSKATIMSIKLYELDGEVHLEMKDNGIGFEMEKIPRKNGLIHMENRIKTHGGSIAIVSIINKGTNLFIKFKLNQNE